MAFKIDGHTTVRLFTSKDLDGLKGDKGEEYCVFLRDNGKVFLRDNGKPLRSTWVWFDTAEKAATFINGIKQLTKDIVYYSLKKYLTLILKQNPKEE